MTSLPHRNTDIRGQIMEHTLFDKSEAEMMEVFVNMLRQHPMEMKQFYYKILYTSFLLYKQRSNLENVLCPTLEQLNSWIDILSEIGNSIPEFAYLHQVSNQAADDFWGAEIQ